MTRNWRVGRKLMLVKLQKAFTSVLIAACLLVFAAPDVAEAKLYRSLSIGSWKGGVYTSNKTGEFSHCAVSAKYKSGITLLFSVTRGLVWQVGFSKKTWELELGKKYPVRYQVDKRKIMDGRARAATKKMTVITLPGSSRLFNQMRRGRVLKVKAGNDLLKFNLTGTNKMLSMLLRCARRNKNLMVNQPRLSNDLESTPETNNPFAEKTTATQPATPTPPQKSPPVRRTGIPGAHYSEAANWLKKTLANSDILYRVVRNEGKAQKMYRKHAVIWRVGKKTGIIGTMRILTRREPDKLANTVLANEARACKGSFASRFMEEDSVGEKKIVRLLTTCKKESGKLVNVYFALTKRQAGGTYLVMLISSKTSTDAVLQAGERMAGSMQISRSVSKSVITDFSEDELPAISDNGGKVVRY
jgi:hypothetical protein